MEQKRQYIAPALTVVSIKAERGYASSATGYQSTSFLDMFLLESSGDYNNQAQQNWSESESDLFSW